MDTPALKQFADCVGSIFILDHDGSQSTDLVLVSATRMASAEASQTNDPNRPFSLLFRGPKGRPFDQGIQVLDHRELGRLEIFLVPMQPDDEGPLYEAVFA